MLCGHQLEKINSFREARKKVDQGFGGGLKKGFLGGTKVRLSDLGEHLRPEGHEASRCSEVEASKISQRTS